MTLMDYPYPAAKGTAPRTMGWPQSPWQSAPVGKYGTPGATAPAGKYGAPWAGQPAGKYGAPWGAAPAGKYAPVQYESPWVAPGAYGAPQLAPQPQPGFGKPLYMNDGFPAGPAYTPGQPAGMPGLTEMLVPALNSVIPAIEGLLRIPSLLMEFGESAELLSRWPDMRAALYVNGETVQEGGEAEAT